MKDDSQRSTEIHSETILAVRNVSCAFDGVLALDSIDIDVRRDERLAITGHNGSGKTSLLNVISGAYQAQGGRVFFKQRNITNASTMDVARLGILRTFQRPRLFNSLTVEENVALGQLTRTPSTGFGVLLRSGIIRERWRTHELDTALDMFGLIAQRQELAGNISSGQRRAVELARAVIAMPAVLLLDEPTAGLSGSETEILAERLLRASEDHVTSMIVVEHNYAFLRIICKRMLVLEKGRIISESYINAIP